MAKGYEVALGEEVGLKKDQLAPNFTLFNLEGQDVTLSELRGKRVVLNFWATWCPPCEAEMPHMQRYYEKYAKEDNVEIVGVNLMYSNGEKVEREEKFIDAFEIHFDIFDEIDKRGKVILDMSEHEGKVEGLPQNLDFIVRRKQND